MPIITISNNQYEEPILISNLLYQSRTRTIGKVKCCYFQKKKIRTSPLYNIEKIFGDVYSSQQKSKTQQYQQINEQV